MLECQFVTLILYLTFVVSYVTLSEKEKDRRVLVYHKFPSLVIVPRVLLAQLPGVRTIRELKQNNYCDIDEPKMILILKCTQFKTIILNPVLF